MVCRTCLHPCPQCVRRGDFVGVSWEQIAGNIREEEIMNTRTIREYLALEVVNRMGILQASLLGPAIGPGGGPLPEGGPF